MFAMKKTKKKENLVVLDSSKPEKVDDQPPSLQEAGPSNWGALSPEDLIADEQPSGIQTLGDGPANSRSGFVSSSLKKMDKV
ncbi:hypothetical protein HHI36_013278 [Cryptolaemus montrouzieri]|uniref:Uncharacterized protein n=1 Tax=Cryptolaemus montrouzieri TaxID=559131 RepID=A0ABD2NHR2_9CUCU